MNTKLDYDAVGITVEDWNTNDVLKWMQLVGLQSITRIFSACCMDGKKLLSIDREFLAQHDIQDRDFQTKILSVIYEIKSMSSDTSGGSKYSPLRQTNNSSQKSAQHEPPGTPKTHKETTNLTECNDKNKRFSSSAESHLILDTDMDSKNGKLTVGTAHENKTTTIGLTKNIEVSVSVDDAILSQIDNESNNTEELNTDVAGKKTSISVLTNKNNGSKHSAREDTSQILSGDDETRSALSSNSMDYRLVIEDTVSEDKLLNSVLHEARISSNLEDKDHINVSSSTTKENFQSSCEIDCIVSNSNAEKVNVSDDGSQTNGSIQVDGSILSSDIQTKAFVISNKTTAKDLISLVLTKHKMASRDPNLFYLTMETVSKNTEKAIQSLLTLEENSRPLELQLYNDKETKFCIQMKSGGLVKVYDSCLTPGSFYKSMFISKKTTTRELIKLLLHYYKSRECVDDFVIIETDEHEKDFRKLLDNECPLIAQQQWKSEKCFQLKRIGHKKNTTVQRSRSFGGVSEHTREHINAAIKKSIQKRKLHAGTSKEHKAKDVENVAPGDNERKTAIDKLRSDLLELQQNRNSVFFSKTEKSVIESVPRDLLKEKIKNLKNLKSSCLKNSNETVFSKKETTSDNDIADQSSESTSTTENLVAETSQDPKNRPEDFTLVVKPSISHFDRATGTFKNDSEHLHYRKIKTEGDVNRTNNPRYKTIHDVPTFNSSTNKKFDLEEFKGIISEKLRSLSRQPPVKKLDVQKVTAGAMDDNKSLKTVSSTKKESSINLLSEVNKMCEEEKRAKEAEFRRNLAAEKEKLLRSVNMSSKNNRSIDSSLPKCYATSCNKSKFRENSDSNLHHQAHDNKKVQSEIMNAKNLQNLHMPVAVRPLTHVNSTKDETDGRNSNLENRMNGPTSARRQNVDENLSGYPSRTNSRANGSFDSGSDISSRRSSSGLLRKRRGRRCLPSIPQSADLDDHKRRLAENAQVRIRAYSASRASVISTDEVSEASTMKNIDNIESEEEVILELPNEPESKELKHYNLNKQISVTDSVNAWKEKSMKDEKYGSNYKRGNIINAQDDLPIPDIDPESIPEYLISPSREEPEDPSDGLPVDVNISFDFDTPKASPRNKQPKKQIFSASNASDKNDTRLAQKNDDVTHIDTQLPIERDGAGDAKKSKEPKREIVNSTNPKSASVVHLKHSKIETKPSVHRSPGDGQDSKEFKEPAQVKCQRQQDGNSITHTINRLEEKTRKILANSQSGGSRLRSEMLRSTQPSSDGERKTRTLSTSSLPSSRLTSDPVTVRRTNTFMSQNSKPVRYPANNAVQNTHVVRRKIHRHLSNSSLVSDSETSGFIEQDLSMSSNVSQTSPLKVTRKISQASDASPEHSIKSISTHSGSNQHRTTRGGRSDHSPDNSVKSVSSYSSSNRAPQKAREVSLHSAFVSEKSPDNSFKNNSSFSTANRYPLSAREPKNYIASPINLSTPISARDQIASRKISKTGHTQEEIQQAKQALLQYASEPFTSRSGSRMLTMTPQKCFNLTIQTDISRSMTPNPDVNASSNTIFKTPQIAKTVMNVESESNLNTYDINRNIQASEKLRPTLHEVLHACDLFNVELKKGECSTYGIQLYESVFSNASSVSQRQSLRSPKGKRPVIGQTNSAFTRVRTHCEGEVKSVISIDCIEEKYAAYHNGHLQEGDYVVEIDGSYVLNAHLETARSLLHGSGDVMKLVVARIKGATTNSFTEVSNLSDITLDEDEENEMLKLKYHSLMLESQQKDKLVEELRSIIVKRAQVRQIKDGMKPYKLNIDDLEEECSAV